MPLYEMTNEAFQEVKQVSFSSVGVLERSNIQRLLRDNIGVIRSDIMVIDEEFGQWEDSKRRIDLLALDKDANLVVIELKRTDDGGHMDLQAIRYAAMISAMRFDQVVSIHAEYLKKRNIKKDAKSEILNFLDWTEPDEEQFGQDVQIVLVAADFSKELTTSVMWLIQRDIDIRCIRLKPHQHGGKVLVDVQQIIPLPEAQDYTIKIKEKERAERASRNSDRDYTKYDVEIGNQAFTKQPKRWAMFHIVKYLCNNGVSPDMIGELIPWHNRLWKSVDGKLQSEEFCQRAIQTGKFDKIRYFVEDGELIYSNGKTYALTNQWGSRSGEAIKSLLSKYQDKGIKCKECE
jgi:hypothetical protein